MNMKELAGVGEAVRAMYRTPEIISIDVTPVPDTGFPRVMITEEEYASHFGRTVPEPHSNTYDQMRTTWSGAEFFCLVDKK